MKQRRNPGSKEGNIQFALDFCRILSLFQEIGGEGCVGNHVRAGRMDQHIGQMVGSLPHQAEPVGKWKHGAVLLHHENMQETAPGGRIGNQFQMPFGQGIAVHDNAAHTFRHGSAL